VNAFYLANAIHDITYKYGFTEKSYNFQNTQIATGGKGNDRVKISVQDNGGTNNANFATPPDGQSGQMRMYLWTQTSPQRDGSLENDIVIHEYTHGISNRMTGEDCFSSSLMTSFSFTQQAAVPEVACKPLRLAVWAKAGLTLWLSGLSKPRRRSPTTSWAST
jgi:hypothetical protein